MPQTQTKKGNGRKNGRSKSTPQLGEILGKKRGPGRPRKPAPSAEQIADQLEKRAKELQAIADMLRGDA